MDINPYGEDWIKVRTPSGIVMFNIIELCKILRFPHMYSQECALSAMENAADILEQWSRNGTTLKDH